MLYKGGHIPPGVESPELGLVIDFLERQHLSKIGVQQDLNALTDFERLYLVHCNSKFSELANKKRQENSKKR